MEFQAPPAACHCVVYESGHRAEERGTRMGVSKSMPMNYIDLDFIYPHENHLFSFNV